MGVGFAIPVKQAAAALSDFFTPEVTHGLWFGLKVKTSPYPLIISAVQPGSPAEKAGLRAGQEIVEVNGKPVGSLVDFNQRVTTNEKNRAAITVSDKGARRTVQAQLVPFAELIRERLGLTLAKLTEQQAASFQANPGQGLLIEAVEKNGPADRAQIKAGFLLTGIDGQSAAELITAASVLCTKSPGERVRLDIVARQIVGNGYTRLQQGTATVEVR